MKKVGKILWLIGFLLCVLNKSNCQIAPSNNNDSSNSICLSKECIKMAGFILDNLDLTADPCKDFILILFLFFNILSMVCFSIFMKVKISINLLVDHL